MRSIRQIALVCAVLGVAAITAAAVPAARQLSHAKDEGEAAWREIAAIQAARLEAAGGALATMRAASAGGPDARLKVVEESMARARAAGSHPDLLHDPVAINAWKRAHGELTGALFMATSQSGAQSGSVLAALRARLVSDEQELAGARVRYSQASAAYLAASATTPGALVATVLRYPELPATL